MGERIASRRDDRIHARQRQLERHAERGAAADDLGFARCPRTARRSWSACARPSDSARAIAARNAGVASGNGLCSSVPSTRRSMPRRGAVHRRLAEQHDVAARRYTSSSGVWYAGGRPCIAQCVAGVDVAHVDGQRDERPHAVRAARAREQRVDDARSAASHARPDADVDRLDRRPRAASSASSTALSRPPESSTAWASGDRSGYR